MSYVDGFVLAVPRNNLAAYRKIARKAGKIWMEFGALAYWECVGDDVPEGKITSFAKSVKLKEGEVVLFSWIVYKSKASRNRIHKQIEADPRMIAMMGPDAMPFDMKRMIYGGFEPLLVL